MSVAENIGQNVKAVTIAAGAGATAVASPAKLKAIWIVSAATAGSLVLEDGTGGTERLDLDTPAAIGGHYLELPDGGIDFTTEIFATLTTATFATLFYR